MECAASKAPRHHPSLTAVTNQSWQINNQTSKPCLFPPSHAPMDQDHYKTLGVPRTASREEIKDAFRKSALQFHPDRHAQSSAAARSSAAAQFRRVSEAYDTLIHQSKRAQYDLNWRGTGRRSTGGDYGSANYARDYYYRRQYGNGGRENWGTGGGPGVEWRFVWRVMTTRHFLTALGFTSILVGSALVIEDVIQGAWARNNSGKSFEDAMDALERTKLQKDKTK